MNLRGKELEYFNEGKYDELCEFLKSSIENSDYDSDTYYYYFLASNKDYSNMDFDNLSNIIYFNKALETANKKQKLLYSSEFSFYKSAPTKLRIITRLVCRKEPDEAFIDYLSQLEESDLLLNDTDDKKELIENLDNILLFYNSHYTIITLYHLLNMINLNENLSEITEIMDDLRKRLINYKQSEVNLKYHNTFNEIKAALINDLAYNGNEVVEFNVVTEETTNEQDKPKKESKIKRFDLVLSILIVGMTASACFAISNLYPVAASVALITLIVVLFAYLMKKE